MISKHKNPLKKTMPITRLHVGQRFIYTGDQANVPDAGEIIEVQEPTKYTQLRYKCKMDSGREKIIEAIGFEKSIGQRFKTEEQVQQERAEQNRQMAEWYSLRTSTK
jgi:hypothetical protein